MDQYLQQNRSDFEAMAGVKKTTEMELRSAETTDEQRLFEWRNLPEILELGSLRRAVSREEHACWFSESLKGELRKLWIVTWNGDPVGQMRFDLSAPDEAEISIYLIPTFTGRGIGIQAIRLGCKLISDKKPDVRVVARVMKENQKSLSAFLKAGFAEQVDPGSDQEGFIKLIWKPRLSIPHNRLTFGEEEEAAVAQVVRSGQWRGGIVLDRLEASFAKKGGVSHAVGVGSGIAALRLSLMALGIGPGDKVIVPAYSCVALANAVLACGGEPVPVDVEEGSWNLSVEACIPAIRKNSRIKAAIAVHTFGYPAPVREIQELGIPVIEDCSHAFGISPLGSMGELAIVSLHSTKLIGCGEGGMILTQDPCLARRVKDARDYTDKPPGAWRLNDKMTDLEAALAECQLARLPQMISRREELAVRYGAFLERLRKQEGVFLPREAAGRIWYRYSIHTGESQEVIDRLQDHRVNAAMPVDNWLEKISEFPVAMKAFRGNVSLPLYPSLTFEEQDAVVSALFDA